MTITNNQSKSIDITSENISNVISNPEEYLQIDITLKMNCCPQEYKDSIIPSSEPISYVNILKPNGNRYSLPREIHFKNFDTGEIFGIRLNDYPTPIIECSDLAFITSIIDSYFNTYFPEESDVSIPEESDVSDSDMSDSEIEDSDTFIGNEIVGTCDAFTKEDSFIYGLSSLPNNIIPLYLDYEFDDVPIMEPFYSAYSEKNSILTNTGISLSPEIIDDVKFPDAVYTVIVSIIKTSGTQIKETQCFS